MCSHLFGIILKNVLEYTLSARTFPLLFSDITGEITTEVWNKYLYDGLF